MTEHPYHLTDQVPARYYAALPGILTKIGVDAAAVLDAAQLPLAELSRPDGMIRLTQLEALVAAATTLSGRDDLGLLLGREIRLRSHSLVGYALLASPTVDYALRLTSRYFRLVFPAFRMRYRVFDGVAEIDYQPSMGMSPACLSFHIDMVTAATHVDLEELLQQKLPAYELALSLPGASAARLAGYRRLMPQVRLKFAGLSHPGMCFRLPAHLISREPAMADGASLAVAEQHCRQLLDQMLLRGSIGDWVKMMLRESAVDLPSIKDLAEMLSISPRTLHRYLHREGLVYRDLFQQERLRRARQLLDETRLSITAIAHELGYQDTSNFVRGFRASEGCTPGEYRRNRVLR